MGKTNDIHLDGSEISVIKAIGLSGAEVDGATLRERLPDLMVAEITDTLRCLSDLGYIEADKGSYHNQEEFDKTHFRVNSGYSRDLKEALDPRPEPKKSRRVRRE
jgi:hypothetical protein